MKKRNTLVFYASIVLIGVIGFAYQLKSQNNDMQTIVREWSGKEFILSETAKFRLSNQSQDTASLSGYTVISYLDSTTCTSCRIKAFKEVIDRMQKETETNIRSLLIIDSKTLDDIHYAIQYYGFNYPYTIDNNEYLSQLNNIPKDDRVRTFLVDSTFHVALIGNPIINPKMYQLFVQEIKKNQKG